MGLLKLNVINTPLIEAKTKQLSTNALARNARLPYAEIESGFAVHIQPTERKDYAHLANVRKCFEASL